MPISGKTCLNYTTIECRINAEKILIMISVRHQEKLQPSYARWTWSSFRYARLLRIYNSANYDSMIAKLITTAQQERRLLAK
jgi:biotin carboxylase